MIEQPCEDGQFWNVFAKACQFKNPDPPCDEGYYWDVVENDCLLKPYICEMTEYFDVAVGLCVCRP